MIRALLFVIGIALIMVALSVALALWLASYAVPALQFETKQEHTEHENHG